MTKHAVTTFWH